MVGAVLRAVVLDEETGALQPVVVRLTRLGAARPGEVHPGKGASRQRFPLALRELVGEAINVERDERLQHLALGVAQGAGSQANGRDRVANGRFLLGTEAEAVALRAAAFLPGLGAGDTHQAGRGDGHGAVLNPGPVRLHDVGRRRRRDEGGFALAPVECPQQVAGKVFLGGEGAQAPGAAEGRLRRVRPEEGRVGGDDAVALDGVVEGDVVALEAPAPGLVPGFAEDGREVELRVAPAVGADVDAEPPPAPRLPRIEDVLQPHDDGGGDVARLAQAGGGEPVGGLLLQRRHGEEGQALAGHGRVVPVATFGVIRKWAQHTCALLGFQQGEEVACGFRHASSGLGRVRGRHGRKDTLRARG